jgi:hypothetical protein
MAIFLQNNLTLSYFFKKVKIKLLKKNFFLETFFLKNYELNSHKLLRLDAYSKYYFLKDFFANIQKKSLSKTMHFYSTLLINDNNFEYSNFPSMSKTSNALKLLPQKKYKKRKKFFKGFKTLSALPTLRSKLLITLKKKLVKKFIKPQILSLTKTNTLFNIGTKTSNFPNELALNFSFQKKTKFSPLLLKYILIKNVNSTYFSSTSVAHLLSSFFFSNRSNFLKKSNIIPVQDFNFILQKKILKIINFDKFKPNIIF